MTEPSDAEGPVPSEHRAASLPGLARVSLVLLIVAAVELMAWGQLHAEQPLIDQLEASLLRIWALGCVGYVALSRSGTLLRRAGRVLLASLSFVGMYLLLEAPAFIGAYDWRQVLSPKTPGGVGPRNRVWDEELLYHRPPHDRFRIRQPGDVVLSKGAVSPHRYEGEFVYDAHGFRNSRDLERADVVVVGDSFVEGFKVDQADLLTEQLARETGLEVLNLGQSGYGPSQELVALQRYGLPLGPKAVAWCFFEGNDLVNEQWYAEARDDWEGYVGRWDSFHMKSLRFNVRYYTNGWLNQAFRRRDSSEAELQKGLFRRAYPPSIRDAEPMWFTVPTFPMDERMEGLWTQARTVLLGARDACREAGAELLILFVPTKFRVYGDLVEFPSGSRCASWELNDLPERVGTWCEGNGIDFTDLTRPLRKVVDEGALAYYVDDAHWSPRGHEVVAEVIRAWLERER